MWSEAFTQGTDTARWQRLLTGSIFKKKRAYWWSGDFVWRCKRIACASSGEDSSTWSSTETPLESWFLCHWGSWRWQGSRLLDSERGIPFVSSTCRRANTCVDICCVVLFHGLVNAVLATGQSKWCGNVWKLLRLLLEGLDLLSRFLYVDSPASTALARGERDTMRRSKSETCFAKNVM